MNRLSLRIQSNASILVRSANAESWTLEIYVRTEQCTEVRFASLLSGGFTTMAVINPPERKLGKRISVHCLGKIYYIQ